MTEFTKEELKKLISWGNVYTDFGNSWTDKIHRPLLLKIQSMIDNYCGIFKCEHCECLRHTDSPNAFCCPEYIYDTQ